MEPIQVKEHCKFQLDMSKMADLYDISSFCIRGMENAYSSNAYLIMLRTSHNKIKGAIGFLS